MWSVIIKILLKATKKTIIQIIKSKTLRRTGQIAIKAKKLGVMKTFAMEVKKGVLKATKTGKHIRAIKFCNDFIKSADKLDTFMKFALKNERFGRNVWNEYDNTLRKDWEKIFRQANNLQFEYEKKAVSVFKKRKGISTKDFKDFKEWYRKNFENGKFKNNPLIKRAFEEEIKVVFESSWIDFGIFIPYGKRQTKGIMCLQLYNTNSQRNPSLFYQWVNVSTRDWKEITESPTGKNFWEKWYNKNRTNPKYLTADSIYYRRKKGNKNNVKTN